MRAHLLAAATATACGLMVLAGCGEKAPEPAPVESSTPTASPSPSVSAAPTMPPEAKKKGAKGAEAFVRHYVALINHAQATGDVNQLQLASAANCGSCDQGIAYVRDIYASGGDIQGGALRIVRVVNNLAFDGQPGRVIDTIAEVAPESVTQDGEVTKRNGGRSLITFKVAHRPAGWLVTYWAADPQ